MTAGGHRRRCRHARAKTDGPGEQAFLDRRLRGFLLHSLANLLVDARHADDDRGPDLAHGLRQLVELRAVSHLRAVVVHDVIESARRDVRKRQKRDASVGGIEVEVERGDVLVGGDVAVGESDALGFAGGAGGVDQRGQDRAARRSAPGHRRQDRARRRERRHRRADALMAIGALGSGRIHR